MDFETKNKPIKKENSLAKFFKSFSVKNMVWFVVGLILDLCGLSFLITIIVGGNINVAPSKNLVLLADTALKNLTNSILGFLYWGIILLLLGALIIALVLSSASRNEDRDRERQLRREQRLKQMADIEKEDITIASTVNDASVNDSSIIK
jgi:hypothetical protein